MKTTLVLLLACSAIALADPAANARDRQFNAEWNQIVDRYNDGHGTIADFETACLNLIRRHYRDTRPDLVAEVRRQAQSERIYLAKQAAEKKRQLAAMEARLQAQAREMELQRIERAIRDSQMQIEHAIETQPRH